MSKNVNTQVVVIGAGPAGYSAAFRSADLGKDVVLVEKYATLGGVCLNVGCIPSKALLHVAKVIRESKTLTNHGITFGEPDINIDKVRAWKESVISNLTGGLAGMSKGRDVKVVQGIAKFLDKNNIIVTNDAGEETTVTFEHAIIACGSSPVYLPYAPKNSDPRIWDSTDALALKEIPKELLVIGGGIIGLEMATVYSSLGSKVEVIEPNERLLGMLDKDITKPYEAAIKNQFDVLTKTSVDGLEPKEDGVYATLGGQHAQVKRYDAVLVSIGRSPNGNKIDAEKAGIKVTDRGFIEVDKQLRTSVDNIFAIGDVAGQPMLAHKGVHEAHVAAEVIAGKEHYFDPRVIPSVAYTDPEIAWVGKTEQEAKAQGINYEAAVFPWAASGRAIASDLANGATKLIIDKDTNRIIGGAVVGGNAGELLGEISLAIELGAEAEDVALTIHAHPTLYETVGLAAEIYKGTITDLPNKKAVKKTKK